MENMTKEQQRVEFDKHRKEIEKIILGCRGIQSRQVHWSEAVPMVAMYITKEFEKFSHPIEKVLDMAEENVQLKRSLKDVLFLLETHANIDLLLQKQDRDKLERARKISKNKS